MIYTYSCENKRCANHYEFNIEQSMNDKLITNCPICGCKIKRVYKDINVGLCFDGSYNSTRK